MLIGHGVPIHQHRIACMTIDVIGEHLVVHADPRPIAMRVDQYHHPIIAKLLAQLVQLFDGDIAVGAQTDHHPLTQVVCCGIRLGDLWRHSHGARDFGIDIDAGEYRAEPVGAGQHDGVAYGGHLVACRRNMLGMFRLYLAGALLLGRLGLLRFCRLDGLGWLTSLRLLPATFELVRLLFKLNLHLCFPRGVIDGARAADHGDHDKHIDKHCTQNLQNLVLFGADRVWEDRIGCGMACNGLFKQVPRDGGAQCGQNQRHRKHPTVVARIALAQYRRNDNPYRPVPQVHAVGMTAESGQRFEQHQIAHPGVHADRPRNKHY